MSILLTFRLTKTIQASITDQHILDSTHISIARRYGPLKTALVKALFHRAKRICSTNVAFIAQLKSIKTHMFWNLYPKQVCNSLLKRLNSNINKTKEQTADDRKKT